MKTAVIKVDGRQFIVQEKGKVQVRRREYEVGKDVSFPEVLLVDVDGKVTLGTPTIKSAKVSGKVTAIGKTEKIDIFKYKAKKRERRRGGYREEYAQISIDTISA